MQRKLTAILSADVADYSGLMEADEAGTLEKLKTHRRRVFDPCVAAHGGRLVQLIGTGALIDFASAIPPFNCAPVLLEPREARARGSLGREPGTHRQVSTPGAACGT